MTSETPEGPTRTVLEVYIDAANEYTNTHTHTEGKDMTQNDYRTGRSAPKQFARQPREPRPSRSRHDADRLVDELMDEWAADMSGDLDVFA